jgi:hypothetical protein
MDELQTARLLECLDGEPIKYQDIVKKRFDKFIQD